MKPPPGRLGAPLRQGRGLIHECVLYSSTRQFMHSFKCLLSTKWTLAVCLHRIHFLSTNRLSFYLGIHPSPHHPPQLNGALSLFWAHEWDLMTGRKGERNLSFSIRMNLRLLPAMEKQSVAFFSECKPRRKAICPGVITAICDQERTTHIKWCQPRNSRGKGQRVRSLVT